MKVEEAKKFIYDELNFKAHPDVKHYEYDLANAVDLYNILWHLYVRHDSDEIYLRLIELIKEHKEELIKKS